VSLSFLQSLSFLLLIKLPPAAAFGTLLLFFIPGRALRFLYFVAALNLLALSGEFLLFLLYVFNGGRGRFGFSFETVLLLFCAAFFWMMINILLARDAKKHPEEERRLGTYFSRRFNTTLLTLLFSALAACAALQYYLVDSAQRACAEAKRLGAVPADTTFWDFYAPLVKEIRIQDGKRWSYTRQRYVNADE